VVGVSVRDVIDLRPKAALLTVCVPPAPKGAIRSVTHAGPVCQGFDAKPRSTDEIRVPFENCTCIKRLDFGWMPAEH
jgi:hypothetical protein